MAITAVDKIKINKYLKEHVVGKMYYSDLCAALSKREKISDIEFLEYFVNSVINEFRKTETISVKHLTKIIYVIIYFIQRMHKSDLKINEEVLNKIRNLSNFYDEYLNKIGIDKDLEFDSSISLVLNTVNELYPSEIENDTLVEYINKISELELEVKELTKKLTLITKSNSKLQTSYDQSSSKVNLLNTRINSLEGIIRDRNNQIADLTNVVESLNVKINDLQVLLSKSKKLNVDLEAYKEKYDELIVEVEKLRKIFEDESLEKSKLYDIKIKHSQMEDLIYNKLLLESVTVDELLKYLNDNKIVSSKEEVFEVLKKLRKTFSIDSTKFSLNPMYKITPPTILEDGQFTINIPNGTKYYDIMLVSDFHIKSLDDNVLKKLDLLNDYCVENGINLILNLGDFYHGTYKGILDSKMFMKSYNIVEQSISLLPKVDGLYHAVLGGNHDKSILHYGFDPIEMLSNEREDIINLGYTHSTILLNSLNNKIGSFDIHHPDTFDFPIYLDENGIDVQYLNKHLNDIYIRQSRTRDDSYIDIFGHTHKSQFNYFDSYCYIPSYFEAEKKGACHLRIYFDSNSQIKYMVFMSLTLDNKLYKNNEIIYKKVLSK